MLFIGPDPFAEDLPGDPKELGDFDLSYAFQNRMYSSNADLLLGRRRK
jgi:hypothetical protein